MILGAPSQVASTTTPSRLRQIAQNLTQEQDILRIQKLLIYACTRTWESDPTRIQATSLPKLLQTLLTIAPTPEQLQTHLHCVVGTLNKAAEYARVAEVVLHHVSPLYPDPQTTIVSPTQESYSIIADCLEQDPEQLRVKKLLVLTCNGSWMSDASELSQISILTLLHNLHQLAPTPESLNSVLMSRVRKLSKQAEYVQIARKIIQACQSLYQSQSATATPAPTSTEETQYLSQIPTQSTPIASPAAQHPTSALPTKASEPVQEFSSAEPVLRCSRSIDSTDLFDVRVEMMRYSNPLQIKILLFSLLHEPFNQTFEHYAMLRNHELDDLLKVLIQSHPLLPDLEQKLRAAARPLNGLGEYDRVAKIVFQALKFLYSQPVDRSSSSPTSVENATGLIRTITVSGEATRPEYS